MVDRDLKEMSYRDVMKWAASKNGRFIQSRLKRIAAARGYHHRWVNHKYSLTLADVLKEIEAYRLRESRLPSLFDCCNGRT